MFISVDTRPQRPGATLPSAVPESPSALKLLVLFFLRCFFLLAWGEGGGSSLGLVELEILGLEHTESPNPVSVTGPEKAKECKGKHGKNSPSHNSQAVRLRPHKALRVAPLDEITGWRPRASGLRRSGNPWHVTPATQKQALISALFYPRENLKFSTPCGLSPRESRSESKISGMAK